MRGLAQQSRVPRRDLPAKKARKRIDARNKFSQLCSEKYFAALQGTFQVSHSCPAQPARVARNANVADAYTGRTLKGKFTPVSRVDRQNNDICQ